MARGGARHTSVRAGSLVFLASGHCSLDLGLGGLAVAGLGCIFVKPDHPLLSPRQIAWPSRDLQSQRMSHCLGALVPVTVAAKALRISEPGNPVHLSQV